MQLLRTISIFTGFLISYLIGTALPITSTTFVVWVWMFCTGLLAKGMIQGFISPFMDVPVNQKVPEKQSRYLVLIRTALVFSGIGFLLGELILYQMVGTISIALVITGIGVHISLSSPKKDKWFFYE